MNMAAHAIPLGHFDSLGMLMKTELRIVQQHNPVWLDVWDLHDLPHWPCTQAVQHQNAALLPKGAPGSDAVQMTAIASGYDPTPARRTPGGGGGDKHVSFREVCSSRHTNWASPRHVPVCLRVSLCVQSAQTRTHVPPLVKGTFCLHTGGVF